MTRRTILGVTGAVALAAGALLLTEHAVVSPGHLAESHEDLKDNCRACHTPFRGASSGCASCHAPLPATNKHAHLGLACATCHQEHQGAKVKVAAAAGKNCSGCHQHPSILGVKRHREDVIERPMEPADHVLNFSHKVHFREIQEHIDNGKLTGDTFDCARCHQVTTTDSKRAGAEHQLMWSGCPPCHKNWRDAGLKDVAADETVIPFARFVTPARLARVRFRHSPGHLRTPCKECHIDVEKAAAIRLAAGGPTELPPGARAAKRTRNCFGCHTHNPSATVGGTQPAAQGEGLIRRAEAAEPRIVTCKECHAFHGTGAQGDFPKGASDEPRPRPWDVLAKRWGVAVTPWLLAFVSLGSVGYIALLRRLPATEVTTAQADPDVAPQRVSEVPALSPSYESSIAGLHIVGELAGVPLINRAMKSGFDAIDFIANQIQVDGRGQDDAAVDVLIAGAGPAGVGAATRAKSLGLTYILCEKGSLASTIRGYPRAKVVQTAPIDIPEYGTFFQEGDESKEALVRRWEDIAARTGLVVNEREEVIGIEHDASGRLVTKVQGDKRYRSRYVVLALGVRGTPRRLGTPGEVPERVAYSLIDPEEFREKRILVVGGGNAACEAALALSAPGLLNEVTLSHRGAVLKDVTAQNSQAIDAAAREGQLRVIPDSVFKEMRPSSVVLDTPGGSQEIQNDIIFALIGAELPTKFLRAIGVKLVKKGGGL